MSVAEITDLKGQQAKLFHDARTLNDAAESEGRSLSAEEKQLIDRMFKDVDELGERIQRIEKLDGIERSLGTSTGRRIDLGDASGVKAITPDVVEQAEARADDGALDPEQRARRNRYAIVGTKAYRDIFWKFMRRGFVGLTHAEARQLNTLDPGTEGGYLTEEQYDRTLVTKLADENVMRPLCTVLTVDSDRNIPIETDHGTAVWGPENVTGDAGPPTVAPTPDDNESEGAYDQKTLRAHKLSRITRVTEELVMDSIFDMGAHLSNQFARAFGEAEELAFVSGTGPANDQPVGATLTATLGVTTAAAGLITGDEVIEWYYALRRPYRRRATWLLHDGLAKALRMVKETTGQYIWQPGLQAGEPDRILGRPVEVSEGLPGVGAGEIGGLFGDFSYYWIADRRGTRAMQRLDELYRAAGQIGYRMFLRTDGQLLVDEAIKTCVLGP